MATPQAQFSSHSSTSTVDAEDVARFSRIADEWWDENGKFAPLHRLNPTRLTYLRDTITQHYGRKEQASNTQPLAGLELLDIGCGGGLVSEPLTRLGANVTGIDASEQNIAIAKHHAENSGLSIHYQAMPPEILAQQQRQYDVVLALEVAEHVADLKAFYAMLARLTKPGGLLITSTINRTAASYAMAIIGAEYVLRWLPKGTHQWSKFIRPSELARGLQAEGLAVADTCGIIYNPIKREFSLNPFDLKVNYFLSAVKPT